MKLVQILEPIEFKNKIELTSTFLNSLSKRLKAAQGQLGMKSQELAALLHITPEWYSKIVNGKVAGSPDISLRLEDVLRRKGIEVNSSPALQETAPAHGRVKDMAAECSRLMDDLIACADGDPGRLGWIREQFLKHLQVPEHWDIHEKVLAEVLAEQKRKEARSAHPQGGGAEDVA